MPSLTQLFTFAACIAVTFAASVPPAARAHCDNAKLIHNTPIEVDGVTVSFTGFSCAPKKKVAGRDVVKRTPSPTNVCGVTCTNTCNTDAGTLPPIIDDCNKIKSAITIFAGITSSTFTVAPYGLESLTFGTCTFFFSNEGSQELESCWSDLSVDASRAGSACFPPVLPLMSEGLCTASDSTWAIGSAHSAPFS